MTLIAERMPRFRQEQERAAPLQLTRRDTDLLHQVARHRFLRSGHLVTLAEGSHQQVLRRLQLLFHHGYLERPRCQLDHYHQGGSREMIYGLGSRGAAHLRRALDMPFDRMDWTPKNRSVGRVFLEHALMVSDFMVSLELSCRRQSDVRLLHEQDLPLPEELKGRKRPFQWSVHIHGHRKLGVVPDAVFGLEYQTRDAQTERAFYFLEADRGTMPVKRDRLERSSVHRKLLAYEATWSQGLHRSRFGWNRFRVITLTSHQARMEHMMTACKKMERGKGLFLFGAAPALSRTGIPLTSDCFQDAWGHPTALLADPTNCRLDPGPSDLPRQVERLPQN